MKKQDILVWIVSVSLATSVAHAGGIFDDNSGLDSTNVLDSP